MVPLSPGIGRGQPVLRSLGWSIAVVLAGGVIAVFTTPSVTARTVAQPVVGLAEPSEELGSPAAPGTVPVGLQTAAGAAAAGTQTTPAQGPAPTAATAAKAKAASTTAATKAAAAAAPAPPAKAEAQVRLQPDAGSYPLRISGSSSVDGKAASVPSSGSLVVEQRGSEQQHRTVGVPGGLVLLQRANAGGVDLVSFSLTAGSKTLTFRPPSPLAFVRTDPGASWSWSVRSSDGSVGLNQTASVASAGTVTVGGTSVPAVTVQRTFTVSGTVQGTVRLTSTVSTVDRLPLVQHEVIDVRATALGLLSTRVVSDTSATLTSTTPR